MSKERNGARLAIASLLLCCSTIAAAAEPAIEGADPPVAQPEAATPPQESPPPQPEATAAQPGPAKETWEFATIGYAWFAGAWGETDVIGPAVRSRGRPEGER